MADYGVPVVMLTEEQQNVVDFAVSGHNMCIFGRAGVGKTTVVETIGKMLTSKGKRCQIVCSSGIACDAYRGMAKTVHAQYGLQTAQLPARLLLERSLGRKNVVDQITDADVLIWDEISMSSQRIFELVNWIHCVVANNALPFGGKQVILVGNFWQLKPISSASDAGRPIYESQLFDKVFLHRFELQKIMRQQEFESRLKKALNQIRIGECNDKTAEYFGALARACEMTDDKRRPVHIYFKKLPVEIHNLDVLVSLPGQLVTFESRDTGYAQYIESTVSKVLSLKPGCSVMLLFNINNKLRNGSRGQFIGIDRENCDGSLLVNFPKVGIVTIERRTWYKYERNGAIKASRTQFPLTPCYAITVHKAQSLNMDGVVVHCSQEFVSGQTYVALSRVREEAALQVIGFERRFLLPPPAKLTALIKNRSDSHEATFGCCKHIELDERVFERTEECDIPLEDDSGVLISDVDDADGETNAKQFFEASAGVHVNLEDVLLSMCDFQDKLSIPPPHFSVKDFLDKISNDIHEDPFSESIKSASKYGTDNLGLFELLVRILWCRISGLFQDYLSENGEEVHMTNCNFTCATARLHELFLTQAYRSDVISAFSVWCWSELSDGQRSLSAQLVFYIYQLFAGELGNLVRQQEETEPLVFNVEEMGPDGRGKVRYVGGWAIRKSLDKSRRYIVQNKLSQTPRVRNNLKNELKKIELLENNIVVHHEFLQRSSTSPETLHVIESRQYRERGLLHISDGTYAFFLLLEQWRVDKINLKKLLVLKNNMVDESMQEIRSNKDLQNKFFELFNMEIDVKKELVTEIYDEVITRYLKMGAGQFLQDFRRDYHIRKSLAHRKALMTRRERAHKKQMKVHLAHIQQDKSPGKKVSHIRLLALTNEVKEGGIVYLYTKNELQHLCSAYEVRYISNWNKSQLATSLVQAIHLHEQIPCHQITSNYSVAMVDEMDEHNQIPVLRLRRL